MDDRYLMISSDGHAGPPPEHYRDYLESKYHQRFDEHQAETLALREATRGSSEEFEKEWRKWVLGLRFEP